MPISILSQKEIHKLITAIVKTHDAEKVDQILAKCHESEKGLLPLLQREKYFRKKLEYEGFNVHVPSIEIKDNRILQADIQFRRKSKFPAPFINRNTKLFNELNKLLATLYPGESTRDFYTERKHIYFGEKVHVLDDSSYLRPKWECALIDEPYSSGQTDSAYTNIRNDFIILKFFSPDLILGEVMFALKKHMANKNLPDDKFLPEIIQFIKTKRILHKKLENEPAKLSEERMFIRILHELKINRPSIQEHVDAMNKAEGALAIAALTKEKSFVTLQDEDIHNYIVKYSLGISKFYHEPAEITSKRALISMLSGSVKLSTWEAQITEATQEIEKWEKQNKGS